MVTTDDASLASRLRLLRSHGMERDGVAMRFVEPAFNFRMSEIQAALGRSQLPRFEATLADRRRVAARYDELLADQSDIVPMKPVGDVRHVYHLYVVRVPNRDELLPVLNERGVGAAVHYPIALHLQPAYRRLGFAEGAFPASEQLGREVMSLPLYAEMDPAGPEYVASVLKELVGARA